MENTALAQRFTRSARYADARRVLERGAQGDDVDREDVVRCQRDLLELNALSQRLAASCSPRSGDG